MVWNVVYGVSFSSGFLLAY